MSTEMGHPRLRQDGVVERIIEFSARNKFLVLIAVAILLLIARWAAHNVPLDAIPDLSDTQVIIYSRWDRSPDIIEDQVTYPIITAMLGAPQVKAIRGFSDFGFSYVYVIFKDGTDLYWARSRTLEYLSKITPQLPNGVQTELGPDATGVGWVFQYALVDRTGQHDLQELRTFQDWSLRYHLQSVPGVAEVASAGGFVKQYQITVDPNRLLAYNLPLPTVIDAVRKGNQETGGRIIEFSGAEYMVRGRGYARSITDLEQIVVSTDRHGTPVLLKHVAQIALGPEIRRGIVDLNGEGDVVSGTVIMRHGEHALNVINRVKTRLEELKPSFPSGVELVVTYDRSDLIHRAMDTLRHQLIEEMIIVSVVILLFLWHFPSAVIPIVTIPIAVLLSFIPLYGLRLTTNLMSLSGIAISIGVLVDGAIVEVENAYKRLEQWIEGGRQGDYHAIRLQALKEVGPSVFFSLLVIAVAFMPIFTLVEQEGRLYKPLAWAKNLTMAIAAILAITLDPAMRMLFTRMEPLRVRWRWLPARWRAPASKALTTLAVGTYYPEEQHPVSKALFRAYEPACRWVLRRRRLVLGIAGTLGVWALLNVVGMFSQLQIPGTLIRGFEDMPRLWEGALLYMPQTYQPGIGVTEAQRLLQIQDTILRQAPEVERVFGKAGRIESPTDPAPLSMMETVVTLKPEREWRVKHRWYSWLPQPLQAPFRRFWPDHPSWEELVYGPNGLDQMLQIPGVGNTWTMPIENRINMLSTGVRTSIGVKVLGSDLREIERIGIQLEQLLRTIRGAQSVIAERVTGGHFVDIDLQREELARYGLSVADAQMIVSSAIGGENITTTIEGRERYPVNVRYPRELREDVEQLRRVLVSTPAGQQIPLAQIAQITLRDGPAMIRDENGLLAAYVYVSVVGRDMGSYVIEAKRVVAQRLTLPPGYALIWSGRYEGMLRVKERLKVVVPLTLFLICLLLYLNTRSWTKTAIVLLAVPFSVIGAVLLLWLLHYNISIAVWVGMIALMGLDAETGIFMLLFLDLAYQDAVQRGRLRTEADLEEAIVHGAVKRIRPKLMTVMAAFMGLLPIMWATGTGADMMKRIAAPMVGGLVTSFILELLVYPVIYATWKWHVDMQQGRAAWIQQPIPATPAMSHG